MKIVWATALMFLAMTTASAAEQPAADLAAGTVLAAKWTYSVDGGKTWSDEAPKVTGSNSPGGKRHDAARAEFTVADPAQIGILKITTKFAAPGAKGGFALTDANSVDRYNVGAVPVLLNTKIVLNGNATDLGHDPNTLYRYLIIEPSVLKTGVNTLELSSFLWHKNFGYGAVPCDLQLEIVPPDRAVLDRLPMLGMIGDDYFGLACRAIVPSHFSVAVTPLEPAGAEARHDFEPARVLKAKVPLPKGTKSFRYSVTVSAGGAAKTYGPYDVRVPTRGVGFRFIAAGGTGFYTNDAEETEAFFAKVRAIHPDLLIHTGNYENCTPWEFNWTQDFIRVAQPTLASIPMFATANITEMESPESFGRTFYFPPDDADALQWTAAIGNVRFVAVEAFGMSEDRSGAGLKWLEETLKNAREDYVLVLNSHAADVAHTGVGKIYGESRKFAAAKIDPLLAKYRVTAQIGNMYRGYYRLEKDAGQPVPTLLTGKAGGFTGLNFKIPLIHAQGPNPHAVDNHYLLFEVKPDCLEMKAVSLDGTVFDTRQFKPRK